MKGDENQMTRGKAVKKVPGGKLIRIEADYEEIVSDVKITGDFFLHPEECLIKIEQMLKGSRLPLDKPVLMNMIESLLIKEHADLIGVSAEDIISTLEEAVTCSSA